MDIEHKFIERLKDFPILYDRTRNHMQVLNERAQIWENLSKEFNFNAKKKYENFRDKYGREKKKEIIALHSGETFTSYWKYYEAMGHIIKSRKPILKDSNKSKIRKDESFEEKEITVKDMNEFYNDFCTAEMTSQEGSDNTQDNRLSNDIFEDEIFKPTLRKSQIDNKSNEKDEDSVFLELLAIKMKKMTLTQKSDFQLEILRKADQIVIRK